MFLVLFVLDNPDLCEEVLNAWDEAGVSGVTILPSSGLGRYRKLRSNLREDFPILPSLEDLFEHEEEQHRTFFSVVPDQAMVDRILDHTQRVVGDLQHAHEGILVVLPIAQVYGLRSRQDIEEEL